VSTGDLRVLACPLALAQHELLRLTCRCLRQRADRDITDERTPGMAQQFTFTATLTPPQHTAVARLATIGYW
jgi:hypothetical protein